MTTATEQVMPGPKASRLSTPSTAWHDENGRANIRSILVPSDMSEESLRSLKYVLPLVETFGAKVVLLHVIDPSLYYTADVPYAYIEEMDDTKETFARLKAIGDSVFSAEQIGGILVEIGIPYETIVEVAEREGADLLILTTHSLKGWRHFLFGSTAETISRYSPCPVMILPKE